MNRTRATMIAAGAAGALTFGLGAAPAHAAEGDATVSILHALPGVTADVYVDGEELVPDFTPGTLTDSLTLPAGTYDLSVLPAGSDPATTAPIAAADGVSVLGGSNVTVVAHLAGAGTPTLTSYVNDTSPVPAGQARLTVRHTASAPAVDVRANGTVIVPALVPLGEASLLTAAGTLPVDVTLAGTSTVAIGPADLTLAEGESTIVYATGSAETGWGFAVQTITGLHSSPASVGTGTGGQADGGMPVPLVGLALGGLLVAALAGHRLLATRS